MKPRATLLVLLLLAGTAFAQAPDRRPREDLLRDTLLKLTSDDAREVSWGAYTAGREGIREAVPMLVGRLTAPGALSDTARWFRARNHLVDALVRLDGRVPAASLSDLLRCGSNPALILICREPERNRDLLLRMFDRERKDARWMAIGNLLCRERAPGFARKLLPHLEFRLTIFVVDGDDEFRPSRSIGIGGAGCGGGWRDPEGFPPVARYELGARRRSGAVLLADGPLPIWYVRAESDGWVSGSRSFLTYDAGEMALGWIADLLGRQRSELGIDAQDWENVVWKSEADLHARIKAAVEARRAAYFSVMWALVARKLVTAEQAREPAPLFSVVVEDVRARKEPAFPDLGQKTRLRYRHEEKADAPGRK